MTWSEAKRTGLALAAVLWDDRDASQLSVIPELHAALRALLTPLAEASPEEKTRTLRSWATCVRGDVASGAERLPARARAQLARHVPRELGRRFIESAPAARADFTMERPLLNSLLHTARNEPGCAHAATHPAE